MGGRYGGVGMTKLHRVYSSLKMHEWVVTQNVFRENWGVNCVKHKAPIFKHDSKTKKKSENCHAQRHQCELGICAAIVRKGEKTEYDAIYIYMWLKLMEAFISV